MQSEGPRGSSSPSSSAFVGGLNGSMHHGTPGVNGTRSRSSNASEQDSNGKPKRKTDNMEDVLRRKQEAERRMAARHAALIAEQNEKYRKIAEQRVNEKKERSRANAEKELRRQKEALDRRQAYLDAMNQKKEAILAKAHAAASRTAALHKAKPGFGFGSGTPRDISYLQSVPKEQRAYDTKLLPTMGPPPPSPTPAQPAVRTVRTSMTTSMYVPKAPATAVRPPRPPPAAVSSVTKSAPAKNMMTQSMYTPSTPRARAGTRPAARPQPQAATPAARPRMTSSTSTSSTASTRRPPTVPSPAKKAQPIARRSPLTNGAAPATTATPEVPKAPVEPVVVPVVKAEPAPETTVAVNGNAEEHKEPVGEEVIHEEIVVPRLDALNVPEQVSLTDDESAASKDGEEEPMAETASEPDRHVTPREQTLESDVESEKEEDRTIGVPEHSPLKMKEVEEEEEVVEVAENPQMVMSLHDELSALLLGDETPTIEKVEIVVNEEGAEKDKKEESLQKEEEAEKTQSLIVETTETKTTVVEMKQENGESMVHEERTDKREVMVAETEDPDHRKEQEMEVVVAPVDHGPPSIPTEVPVTPADPVPAPVKDEQPSPSRPSSRPVTPPEELKKEIMAKYEQEEKERDARKARLAAIMNRHRTNNSPPNGTVTSDGGATVVATVTSSETTTTTIGGNGPASPAMTALQRIAALGNNPKISQVLSKHGSNPSLIDSQANLPGAVPEPPQDPLIVGPQ